MARSREKNTVISIRILRFAGWLLAALLLLAVGNALLNLIKTGRYVLDMFVASLLWPLALLLAVRRWPPLYRILLVFIAVMAAYALIAVTLGLFGYQHLVSALFPWPAASPIHLLPGALQTFAVLVAACANRCMQ